MKNYYNFDMNYIEIKDLSEKSLCYYFPVDEYRTGLSIFEEFLLVCQIYMYIKHIHLNDLCIHFFLFSL